MSAQVFLEGSAFRETWLRISKNLWRIYQFIIPKKIWDKVFMNEPNNICGRKPLRNWKGYGLL